MTITPHDRSFIAFACWLGEMFDFYDAGMTGYVPTSLPAISGDQFADQLLTYYARSAADTRELHRIVVREDLAKFVPVQGLATEQADMFVNRYAESLMLGQVQSRTGALQRHAEKQRLRGSTESSTDAGKWRPRRRTMGVITAGGYLSLPDDKRTLRTTADLLNRGVPTGCKNVGTGHVRDALRAFARLHYRALVGDNADSVYRWVRMNWDVFDRLWIRALEYARPEPLDSKIVQRLEASGALFEWRREAEMAAVRLYSDALPLHAMRYILQQALQDVQAARRRKDSRPVAKRLRN